MPRRKDGERGRKGQDAALTAEFMNVGADASISVRGSGAGDREGWSIATPQAQDERKELDERAARLGDGVEPGAV